ncbi:MAG: SDR family NAD(P)-dependent oxidoreductase [Anaerolineae bacterium]|nr:SDR family NAD(P)-dependent oxidoreductase [Anaerolineae bacterium]
MAGIEIKNKAVLVTGASSGIGRAISENLADAGVTMLACARKQSDINALDAIPNITGLRLDVTNPAEIKNIAHYIDNQRIRLYAIINNAGIAVGGPMLILPEQALRECLEVNTIAPVNIIRELYPLMHQKGIIINVSSMGARYISPWMAPYHMSKVALEAYSASLRMEVQPFGIRVVVIEPGAVRTAAFDKWDRLLAQMRGTVYEQAFNRYWAYITTRHQRAMDPKVIAAVVNKVLRNPRPRKRYLIPHHPLVRVMVLLATLGWSDIFYRRFLRQVRYVPPGGLLHESG